jgi:hypothetical protein
VLTPLTRHVCLSAPSGPGKYEVGKYSDFAPGAKGANRWSFGGKTRLKREDDTPGPDKVSTHTAIVTTRSLVRNCTNITTANVTT